MSIVNLKTYNSTNNIILKLICLQFNLNVYDINVVIPEATSTGVYHKQIMRVTLESDTQGKFGLTLGPNPKLGTIIIVNIETRSPAERLG